MVDAICKEIELRKNEIDNQEVNTIYFGGGTPSILNQQELLQILDTIKNHYQLSQDLEITLEANPDDLSEHKLKEIANLGVNRLSIGVQSFNDRHLKWMNRGHTTKDTLACIENARTVGIHNISIDLIYGLPEEENYRWKDQLTQATKLDVQHISAYALTVEPKTQLFYDVTKGKVELPPSEVVSDQFLTMLDHLKQNGFKQYEVSNFCKDDFHSKHNSAYWKNVSYLGFGPSAHSYTGMQRRWNVSNNSRYIKALENGGNYFEEEFLSKNTAFNEYIMVGLRTNWGIDLDTIQSQFNIDILALNPEWIEQYRAYFQVNNNKIILSEEGLLLADKIASDLMIVDG